MTDAISGTRRQMRELVDGTIEVKVHIDPRFKADFNRLFPNIDAPVALAPLVRDFERVERAPGNRETAGNLPGNSREEIRETVERKGGPISKWLGARCNEPLFWAFLNAEWNEGGWPIQTADSAAARVRQICAVRSRADFDHDQDAREKFEQCIRGPYQRYLKGE